jgi:hypothetical protein
MRTSYDVLVVGKTCGSRILAAGEPMSHAQGKKFGSEAWRRKRNSFIFHLPIWSCHLSLLKVLIRNEK